MFDIKCLWWRCKILLSRNAGVALLCRDWLTNFRCFTVVRAMEHLALHRSENLTQLYIARWLVPRLPTTHRFFLKQPSARLEAQFSCRLGGWTKPVNRCTCEGTLSNTRKRPSRAQAQRPTMLHQPPRSAMRRKRALQSLARFPTAAIRVECSELGLGAHVTQCSDGLKFPLFFGGVKNVSKPLRFCMGVVTLLSR